MILKHKSDGITPLCNSLPFPHSCLWHLKTKFLVLAYKPQYSSRCLPFWLRLLLLCTSFMLLPPPTLASYWCCCCFFNTQSSCFKVLAYLVLSSPWNTLPPALNMVGSSWHSNLSLQFTSERHSLNTYSKVASHPHLFSMTSLYIMFTIIYLFIDSHSSSSLHPHKFHESTDLDCFVILSLVSRIVRGIYCRWCSVIIYWISELSGHVSVLRILSLATSLSLT